MKRSTSILPCHRFLGLDWRGLVWSPVLSLQVCASALLPLVLSTQGECHWESLGSQRLLDSPPLQCFYKRVCRCEVRPEVALI